MKWLLTISEMRNPDTRRSVDDVACIPLEGRLFAPRDLAFKGNQGDYWGSWKTVISARGLPDDIQELYRQVGVIRGHPEPRTSRAFFTWLATQSSTVIAEHMPQVLRHISHGKSMTSWWLTPPEIAFIPAEAHDGGGLLLTPSQAVKRCLANDFPALAEELRAASPSPAFHLTIDTVKQTNTPIFDELKAIGIPTLRQIARGPISVRFTREVPAPPTLDRLLAAMRSDATARQLRKQLKEFDIPSDILEPRWQNRLASIGRVRVGTGLRAEYKISRRSYFPFCPSAALPETGEFWLEDGPDLEAAFFGAVSALVFTARSRYLPLVLKAALHVRVHEFDLPSNAHDDEGNPDPVGDPPAGTGDDEGPSESFRPHPGGEPEASKRKPNPGPLFEGGSEKVRPPSKPISPRRSQVVDEDVQRHELKEDHYLWHCQVALATAGPSELAPPGSYVEYEENRRKMIEAHHLDKVSAGGLRNAGNLLIVSHVNHERFGRAISRQQVTDALLGSFTPKTILDADGSEWVKGFVANVLVPATGERVPIFFTHAHRKYWLEMAGHKVDDSDA